MSIALAPTTELDAVNEMLATIGEAPVNQLDNLGLTDAATARNRLYDAMRRVQKRGWYFNTDFALALKPDSNGNVWLPANTLKLSLVGPSKGRGLTQRGNQVYDAINHTFTFTAPVVANLVSLLAWEQLPESARQFIFLTAATRFQAGFLGSDILDKFTSRDLAQAWSDLLSEELEISQPNMLTDSDHMILALDRTP
jgi:hypothetical protein